MTANTRSQPLLLIGLLARICAAIFGSYVIAALFSIAVLALPVDRPQAVIAGTVGSFAVYACGALWSFIARTPTKAWLGLCTCGLILAPGVWLAMSGNG